MLNEEFEAELKRVRQALANSMAVEKQLEAELKKNSEQQSSWQKRSEMASKSNQEELARQADLRLAQFRKSANQLEIELLSQKDFSAGLNKELARLETRRFTSGSSGAEALAASDASLSTISRLEQKIAEHESYAELSSDNLGDKMKASEKEDAIEAELKALKAKKND